MIVDRYADYLICQFLSSGSDFHKKIITETLDEVFNPIGIYERSDVEIRIKEGLEPTKGTLSGKEPRRFNSDFRKRFEVFC